MKKVELLAPAGNYEALTGALMAGADAVYLGGNAFGARAYADNFSKEEICEGIRYAHILGKKIYLTVNTLVKEREFPSLYDFLLPFYENGLDGVIIQDMGVFTFIREHFPGLELHASTQMTITGAYGASLLKKEGACRIVPARELSLKEIIEIKNKVDIEIETFVHGAMCYCYSGQCLFSSILGGRSGNRGRCAQPCRLPYGYDRFEEKYPLSLRDNCLIRYLDELDRMGVASIKIEGRMKRPEYVATVTGIYRSALDGAGVGREQMEALRAAFSRQGFTQGYYEGAPGRQMFGTRLPEQENKALLQSARATYESIEPQRVPVQFYAIATRGQNLMLAVQDDDGNICKAQGQPPEEAQRRAVTPEELAARLSKTGGTPFVCRSVRSVVDPGLSIPAAELNRLRREVLAHLSAVRGRRAAPEIGAYHEPSKFFGQKAQPALTVSVLKAAQITPQMLRLHPAMIYVPLSEVSEQSDLFRRLAKEQELAVTLPRVIRDDETRGVLDALENAASLGIRRVLIGNLGHLPLVLSRGMEPAADFGMNVFNSRAMETLRHLGFVSCTASFELSLPQLRDISKPLPTEMIVYGRLPLMLTENCIIKNRTGACTCHAGPVKLVDRMGEEFRVVRDCGTCRSVVLNGKKLYLLDKKENVRRIGLWALRLSFTTENTDEVNSVLSAWTQGASFDPGACTRGLYLRGVE